MRILAGIVLYNPDLNRLKQNVEAVSGQVDGVVFVDNNSNNINELKKHFLNTMFVENDQNYGIAKALNQIFDYAIEHNYDYVFLLDQDSVTMDNLISRYKKCLKLPNVGILSCKIKDRNFDHDRKDDKQKKYIQEEQFCITSGSFISVNTFSKVGRFDESMFIDSVDFDYCIRVRKAGMSIYRINYIGLLHEVGHGKRVRILWRDFVAFNHSPFRNYYMARNDVYLTRKHGNKYNPIFRVVTREIISEYLILRFENDKLKKLTKRWQGIRDAFMMKVKTDE